MSAPARHEQGLDKMCKAHPGVFELAMPGCTGRSACNASAAVPGEEGSPDHPGSNAVFLVRCVARAWARASRLSRWHAFCRRHNRVDCTCVPPCAPSSAERHGRSLARSLKPEVLTVRAAFKEFDVVAYRDYIFQNRQGLNSLRQNKADIPAAKPGAANAAAAAPAAEGAGAEEAALVGTIAQLQARLDAVRAVRAV